MGGLSRTATAWLAASAAQLGVPRTSGRLLHLQHIAVRPCGVPERLAGRVDDEATIRVHPDGYTSDRRVEGDGGGEQRGR